MAQDRKSPLKEMEIKKLENMDTQAVKIPWTEIQSCKNDFTRGKSKFEIDTDCNDTDSE